MAMSKSRAVPNEDRTRFLRLGLVIIDELTPILRDLLRQEIQPNDIHNKVKQWGVNNLNLHQLNVISTAHTDGYKNFDITLLYTLLRNICAKIPSPTQNWGVSKMPSQNEITVGDDIERIRLIRNKVLGHIYEAVIPKIEFQNYWSDISDICARMQTKLHKDYVKMLQEAKECTMDSDTESKYMELIKRLAEEDKTTKDLLQKVLEEKGLTSKEKLKIEAKDGNKRTFVEALTDVGIDILNEMVKAIDKMTSESEIDQLYTSIEIFLEANKEDVENMDLLKFLNELKEKIKSYAKPPTANGMRIFAKCVEFIVRLQKQYRAYLECSRGCLTLLMTFSSIKDYDCYKKDLENGDIGKLILELFLYPPFLASFGLKVEDLVVYLNGRLLTQETTVHGLTSKENLKIEAKDEKRRTYVENLSVFSIAILNEMVNAIHKITSESEIDQLNESIEEFLEANQEESENMDLPKFFKELKKTITSYATCQTANRMRIFVKCLEFIVRLRKEYRVYLKMEKNNKKIRRGSLILLMTFSSRKDYDHYKKDLENGDIGKLIHELFLYPPFLASFGLKVEDLFVYLNGRLLTQETTLHGTSSCVHENQFVPEEYSMDCVKTFRELLSREDKDGKRTFPKFLESLLSTLIYIEISTPKRVHIPPKRAIHISVSTRSEDSKRILVRKRANVCDKDELDNYSIHLHLVNTIESEQLKEWLVKYRVSIYQNDREAYLCLKWKTDLREEMDTVYKHLLLNVLELAVQLKKEKLISSLLHNGPRDDEMKDEATALALHVLFKNFKTYCRPHDGTFERLLRMFLDRRTCVNRKDVEGNSVLHLAVIALDAESRDTPCKTSPDAERILQILLDSECEINATDKNGRTPLGCICYSLYTSQSAKLGIFLLSNGADPNIDFALNGALQNIISKQLQPGVVDSSWKTLINHMIEKTDCSKVQKDGVPGIISVIKLGDVNIVKALIKRKVNIHATDGNGSSCLLLACDLEKVSERNAISTLLLQHGCPLNEVNRSGESALLKLLERITDCKDIIIKSEKSKTVAEIDLSLFNQLVCGGADMQSSRFKDSILVTLTRNGFFGAASTLVKCGYDLKKDVLFDGNNPANETLLTFKIGSKLYIRDGYDREKKSSWIF